MLASLMFAKRTMLGAAVLMLAACAGQHVKMTPEDQRSLSSQSQIHAVHHQLGVGFMVESTGYTAVGVIFSPLVVGLMAAEGSGLRSDLKLEDPAQHVKERLVSSLRGTWSLTNLRAVAESPQDDNLETLKKVFDTGVVLDVRTRTWGIDNNRAKYSARVRLIRLADSVVFWQAACNDFVAGKQHPAPSRDALIANEGELLKAKLREAADGCADQLFAWATGKDG